MHILACFCWRLRAFSHSLLDGMQVACCIVRLNCDDIQPGWRALGRQVGDCQFLLSSVSRLEALRRALRFQCFCDDPKRYDFDYKSFVVGLLFCRFEAGMVLSVHSRASCVCLSEFVP